MGYRKILLFLTKAASTNTYRWFRATYGIPEKESSVNFLHVFYYKIYLWLYETSCSMLYIFLKICLQI